jgi:putative tricarboxylic transport membrane protein
MAPARALALLLVAVGLAAALDALWRMPLGAPSAPGPGLLPLALGLVLAALGGAALGQRVPASAGSIAGGRVALVGVLLVLYPLLLPRIGFGLTTLLVLFALGRVIAPLAPARLALFALVATVVAVVLFRQLLAVPLPVGPWGF